MAVVGAVGTRLDFVGYFPVGFYRLREVGVHELTFGYKPVPVSQALLHTLL